MGIALWCDVKDKGHVFDEREAIVVNGNADARYFCPAHCIPAFVTAFHTARAEGESGIYLPTLGGHFKILPHQSQPVRDSGAPGGTPDQATAEPGSPLGGGRSAEAAQAIADLLEKEPQPRTGTGTLTNYGGRA